MQRAVSILHLLVGLVCGAAGLPFIQLMLTDPGTSGEVASAGRIFLVLSLFFFWPSICVGIWGLVHFRSARPVLLVVGGLYVFLFPVGTMLGVLTLAAIVGPRRASAERDRTIGLLLAMGVTGSVVVLALSLLFHVNRYSLPGELRMLILPAAIALTVCLPLLLRRIGWSHTHAVLVQPGVWKRESEWRRQDRERRRLELQRIEGLARDPATAGYAAALTRGEYWSDEAIEYDRNPALLVTAPPIRSIERAMRDAGIPLRRGLGATLTAHCRIDPARLYAQFPPDGRYRYTDDFHFDRPSGPGEKVIISTAGTSYIHIVDTSPDNHLPVFPPPATSP